tara:strand:+ start:877 stop:1587 length:711 start_codon:yes stop_codon:yes gene_type:complete
MAGLPNFIEGAAFGVLNDVLAGFRDNNGFAQPNRYEIIIIPPAKIGGGGNENIFNNQERQSDLRKISLRASTVTLPGRNLSTAQESNVYGPDREIVEGVTYADDISMSFQASSGLDERVYFENWQRQAFNEKTWNIGYYKDYTGEIEIYVLDKQDQKRYGIKLWEVFPKTIGATELSYGSIDEIILLPVSFTFRYWTSLDQNQNPQISLGDRIFNTVVSAAEREITRNIPQILNRL